MKRLLTFAIALVIASVAFGQKAPKNPLESELNYKHPLAARKAKSTSETFGSENVTEAKDYKHLKTNKTVQRARLKQGSGATDTKHPLG